MFLMTIVNGIIFEKQVKIVQYEIVSSSTLDAWAIYRKTEGS